MRSRSRKSRGDKYKYSTGQLFSFAHNSYFDRTSRPVYALIFLLPFIIFYELGTIFINTDILSQTQIRVVAFVWMQEFLEYVGFGPKLAWTAPAIAVVIILVALQIASGKKWQFSFGDFAPMMVECILLALPLIMFSLILNSSAGTAGTIAIGSNHLPRSHIAQRLSYRPIPHLPILKSRARSRILSPESGRAFTRN